MSGDASGALRWALAALVTAWIVPAQLGLADERVEGAGIYLMEPGMPSVFTVDRNSMSCSVSWGTMGAPGPGPVTMPEMGLDRANFAMIVFSLSVDSLRLDGNRLVQTGKARSITTVDDKIAENAVYDFTVEAVDGGAVDGGPGAGDSFSLTLHGADLMFDGHTFAPGSGAGLVSGDIVIGP